MEFVPRPIDERMELVNFAIAGLTACLMAVDLPAGTELQYTGTLSQQTKDGMAEVKSFTLYAVSVSRGKWKLAMGLSPAGARGGGGWGWPERFGLIPEPGAKTRPIATVADS